MARITAKNTVLELAVLGAFHARRFRLYRRDLPGRPNIVLPGSRTVVFVHGCFWHRHPGCSRAATPCTGRIINALKPTGLSARPRTDSGTPSDRMDHDHDVGMLDQEAWPLRAFLTARLPRRDQSKADPSKSESTPIAVCLPA